MLSEATVPHFLHCSTQAEVAAAGVDQNLPGNDYWFDPNELAADSQHSQFFHESAPSSGLSEVQGSAWEPGPVGVGMSGGRHGLLGRMARRVLGGALRSGAFTSNSCHAGCDCRPLILNAVASSARNRLLARRVASAAVVLLKNCALTEAAAGSKVVAGEPSRQARPPLPLSVGARVALLGSACDARPIGYHSGAHPDGDEHSSQSDTNAASAESSVGADSRVSDWTAGDYYSVGGSGRVLFRRHASVRHGLVSAGVNVTSLYTGDDASEAAAAMAGVDVAIACAGGVTQESRDRDSLRLDQHDFLEALVARTAALRASGSLPPLITIALAPGAVLTDWADASDAAVILFLGGEATGDALADALTGRTNPSGRLPVTLPLSEDDVTPPSDSTRVVYAEGVHHAWRALQGKPVRFPFGHGLSYTTFGYTWVGQLPSRLVVPHQLRQEVNGSFHANSGLHTKVIANVSVYVTNVGTVTGAEVVQLYLGFPRSAQQPSLVLRGFQKTRALSGNGDAAIVTFPLTRRDLSTWRPGIGWELARGAFQVVVGASSRDHRLVGSFAVPYEREGAADGGEP